LLGPIKRYNLVVTHLPFGVQVNPNTVDTKHLEVLCSDLLPYESVGEVAADSRRSNLSSVNEKRTCGC
jgi:hypothetical protein